MIYIVLIVIILILSGLSVFLYLYTRRTLSRLDSMLSNAIDGNFVETDFSEKRLSKIEAKMYRYLSMGKTSLRQVNQERDSIKTLISDISHQTKTPLANLQLYTQLLDESETLSGEAKSLSHQINKQAEKLHFLISSLIKTSRLENGIVTVNPKPNKIGDLLAGLDFKTLAKEKNILLNLPEIPDSTAVFDLKWTLEALSNIVDNALKYTPPGGSVTVSLKEYEMFFRIDVADTGIGLSEEETAKIFTRFYRSPRVYEESGSGLGLYLAREILTKENGYIKAASRQGCGSTFSVFLPKQISSINLSKL